MELFRIIKKDAKAALGFCWGRLFGACLIIALFYLAVNLTETVLLFIFAGGEYSLSEASPVALIITGICSVLYLLVLSPLFLGLDKLCLGFANGEDENISVIFEMFSSPKKFIGSAVFEFMNLLRHGLVLAFSLVPGSVLIYIIKNYMPTDTEILEILKIAGIFVGFILILLCSSLGIIFSQRWSLAPYYRARGEKIHRSFKLSVLATKEECTLLMGFRLGFCFWALTNIFILPAIWSVPYYLTANAIYAKYLMEKYERSLAEIPEI